ncbi:hypothetical protein ACIHFD_25440 [Nonomuraea sp. NPDC051941]|uniref:hypothetical protein n=1 Tax=Nonomuraea sp. NPDC051941 TaxID=3364373 RepID=UPI0037C79CEA
MVDSDMISVRRFSLQGSIWRQRTPMMEQLVRWINSRVAPFGRPINVSHEPNRSALVSETAFRRAAVGAPLFRHDDGSENAARDLLLLLPRGLYGEAVLTEAEQLEVDLVQQNIMHYASTLTKAIYFHPVPGCGVVSAATADIVDANGITEIKAVGRAFRGNDLRQLLTYAAMLYASGASTQRLNLYNPRRAILFSSGLDEISLSVCGRSSVELMQDLVDDMIGFQVSA